MFALLCAVLPGSEAATTRTFVFELGNEQLTSEASGGVVVVSLSRPHRSKTVTVDYAMSPITATPGDDYVSVAGTLRFKPGKRTKTIPVTIPDDDAPEGAESFELVLSNPRRAVLPPDPSVTITIQRDAPLAGDLVITELQIAPVNAGEYAELRNTSAVSLDLQGVTLVDDPQSSACVLASDSINAGGRLVLSDDLDVYGAYCASFPSLGNNGDTVALWSGTPGTSDLLDSFTYPTGFALSARSSSLDPDSTTTAANDLTSAWCATPDNGSFQYDAANHGTPGQANPQCP